MNEQQFDLVSKILLVLLQVALPPFVAYLVTLFNKWQTQLHQREDWEFIQQAVKTAVYAAEQLGLDEDLQMYGERKLEYAIQAVERMLVARGINMDIEGYTELIRDMIEAALKQADFQHTHGTYDVAYITE